MNRVKELRKKKGMTQLTVQALTGVDQGDLSKIENGLRNLTAKCAVRIAKVLDTNEEYLLGRSDDPAPRPD